ncbi:uncharacterized protein [Choristoneura fumiferana]|uniref:uncharacterized protein n=1 Tax=Choristoneura fumiferana TaxID=7141 RepID=UPI003D158A8B
MLQYCSFILILAIEIANGNVKLPVVYLPTENIYYQNPPKLPRLLLPEQKFSFPPVCSTLPNWEDVGLSLKILTEMTEPKHETSAFTSLINLIKFILVKEEMTCDNISTIQEPPEKRITNAVNTLDNSQILAKIEAALAKKPRRKPKKIAIVEFHDSIDVPNMLPILRPRGNSTRKKSKSNIVVPVTTNQNSTCQPKTGLTLVGVKPIATVLGPNVPCQTKCAPLRVSLNPLSLPVQCQSCQRTPNVKPIVLGCQNCNICQKLTSIPLTNCQKLTAPLLGCQTLSNSVLAGCQKLNSVLTRPQIQILCL